MSERKKKLQWDGPHGDDERYVKAWFDGRSEIAVQVWNNSTGEGEPAGDWGMPRILGLDVAIAQAKRQTR